MLQLETILQLIFNIRNSLQSGFLNKRIFEQLENGMKFIVINSPNRL